MMNIPRSTIQLTNLLKSSNFTKVLSTFGVRARSYSTEAAQSTPASAVNENSISIETPVSVPPNSRFVYPEFLPDPNPKYRNLIKEKLERQDMLSRRAHLDIPEFYVGSILAVTTSDKHSVGKTTRFLGICIDRGSSGLRSFFILRNAVDNQGIEVKYEMYDPTIQKIEVILLEKRLDDQLYYLRDAPLEYSTFDLNMEAKYHPEGEAVPVNPIQVTLRPRPWIMRWERKNLKGVKQESIDEHITDKMRKQKIDREEPWHQWDLMKHYRTTIPEEEQLEIYSEIHTALNKYRQQRHVQKRSRMFVKPKKSN